MERLTERKWTSNDNSQPTIVLDNCAHCGGVGEFRDGGYKTIYVQCRTCGMMTPAFELKTKAVAVWNKRVSKIQYV
jgi:hypothetical protein